MTAQHLSEIPLSSDEKTLQNVSIRRTLTREQLGSCLPGRGIEAVQVASTVPGGLPAAGGVTMPSMARAVARSDGR
jgi:hypothetical protein